MKIKEFGNAEFEFRKAEINPQRTLRLSGKSRRVSEYPQSPEAVTRMGGGRSEGAKQLSTAEAQRTRRVCLAEGESPCEAQQPNKPEANFAWARGGCVGAKVGRREVEGG